ncbi:MAG: ATP-binding cassette domain-containing protein [Candidatus Symbiodolus clandestinus]
MLQLQQISHTFVGHSAPTLNNISLQLAPGDFCVMMGANGSGKSTLLQILSGMLEPSHGQISMGGQLTTAKQRRAVVSHMLQSVDQATLPALTLLENLVLSQQKGCKPGLYGYQRLEPRIRQQVAAIDPKLTDYLQLPLVMLSGGQRQRAALLMALNANPRLLLLDEHTAALDPRSAQQVMAHTAKQVASAQITTLMVTHQLEDAIYYGNRLLLLHQGQIVQEIAGVAKAALTRQQLLLLFVNAMANTSSTPYDA